MMASALQMTGTEMGDYLTTATKVDTEEVVTREQLKRATNTQIRQVMRALRASRATAAAASGGGAAGGAGGGGEPSPAKRTMSAGSAKAGL